MVLPIVFLGVVSGLFCVLCCAARFGVSNRALEDERERIAEHEAEPERRDLAA